MPWHQIGTKTKKISSKETIKSFFEKKIDTALKIAGCPLKLGDNLSSLLKGSDEEIVKIVTPRAVKKWASSETLSKWEEIIKDNKMVLELREIGKSIANSMRPIAGNTFTSWIAKILNHYFEKDAIPLKAVTKGVIKKQLNEKFIKKTKGKKGTQDYKPDIDIILVRTDQDNRAVAIISAKTTLAERVMQTISWSRYLKFAPNEHKEIKLFLVTAWDTFENSANRERVQELDGVYVCNKDVKEYGNIKVFSKITEDLKKLY